VADDVDAGVGVGGAKGDSERHVGANGIAHHAPGVLGCEHQVESQTSAALGHIKEAIYKLWKLSRECRELIDYDDQSWRWIVWRREGSPLTLTNFSPQRNERSLRKFLVEVGHHSDHMGEGLQRSKCRTALVIDQ